MTRIITFGTFDVFHVGHLRILEAARALGDVLYVGISTDGLNYSKKARYPVYDQSQRREIVAALSCVDHVFWEESLEQKGEYITRYEADALVMGSDWEGRFDEFRRICQVIYLPRTPSISTTELIEKIRS